MIRRILALVALAALLTGCAQPNSGTDVSQCYIFTDDTGAQVQVPYVPKTVAVLTSSLADLWCVAGGTVDITVGETVERGFASDDVILVDKGAGKTILLEQLVAAKPDFVLYSADLAGQRECAAALKAAGIPAAGFSVENFDDYLRLLRICTDILQNPQAYETYGTQLQARVDAVIATAQAQPEQPKILFVRAGSSAKYTKAKNAQNHFACTMLQQLGAYNIADSAPILLDGLSMEEILLQDPDMILFTTMGDEASGVAYMESLVEDPVWQQLTAVKNGNVFQLPKELFQYKPNAQWDVAYVYLIQLLYGDIL